MNVLHTISSLGVNSGGPPLSTSLTVKGLRQHRVNAEILTFGVSSPDDKNIVEDDYVHFLLPPVEQKFAYSNDFKKFLKDRAYDIYHCQGIWQYPSHITAKQARQLNKPYIITPRGMLYPQQLKPLELHKKMALALYQKKDLQQAACIQATCREELTHLRNLGITAPIAVIPNPIETNGWLERPVKPLDKLRFGYLGRLHPRKKVERMLYAWHRLADKTSTMELLVMGAGDDRYQRFLKNEARRLQLHNVIFTGFVSGTNKEEKLASLSYLVVPSDFENFGMVVTEALARGIPVIASKGTPWQDLETYECGWWVQNNVKTLTDKMDEAITIPEEEQLRMAKNGRKLVREKYAMGKIGLRLKELYCWLLGKAEKPEFVYN